MRYILLCLLFLLLSNIIFSQQTFVGEYYPVNEEDDFRNPWEFLNFDKYYLKINKDATFNYVCEPKRSADERSLSSNFTGSWNAKGDTIYLFNSSFKKPAEDIISISSDSSVNGFRIIVKDLNNTPVFIYAYMIGRLSGNGDTMSHAWPKMQKNKELVINDLQVKRVLITLKDFKEIFVDLSAVKPGSLIEIISATDNNTSFFNGRPYLLKGNLLTELSVCNPQLPFKYTMFKKEYYNELSTYYLGWADGDQIVTLPNGNTSLKCTVLNGKLDGPYLMYNRSGNLWREYILKEGRYNGLFQEFKKNGLKKHEISYRNDTVIWERCYTYYKNTTIKELWYAESKKDAIIHYMDETPIKSWKPYRNFTDAELGYKPANQSVAKTDGYYKCNYENGKLKAEGQLKNKKKIGPWKYYNTDGNLIETKIY